MTLLFPFLFCCVFVQNYNQFSKIKSNSHSLIPWHFSLNDQVVYFHRVEHQLQKLNDQDKNQHQVWNYYKQAKSVIFCLFLVRIVLFLCSILIWNLFMFVFCFVSGFCFAMSSSSAPHTNTYIHTWYRRCLKCPPAPSNPVLPSTQNLIVAWNA